jgi:hypothetical protein
MFATIQWLQTWPSFFYGRYAAARPITAPLFFESETAGLMFVLHHWPQGFRWLFFSWFPRENAAADYKHGHSQNEDHKLHLLHRGVLRRRHHYWQLTAILRASSLLSNLAAERRLGSSSSAGITDDETSVQFLDGPRRREAAGRSPFSSGTERKAAAFSD